MSQTTVPASTRPTPTFKALRQGDIPGQGINHPLHYLDDLPVYVRRNGCIYQLEFLDFIEAKLSVVGWVILDDTITLINSNTQNENCH